MAIKFSKITDGMTLFDIHSHSMGNTTMRILGKWQVKIITVDSVTETALVSWNGNAPKTWAKKDLEKLYSKEPKKYVEQQARIARGGLN